MIDKDHVFARFHDSAPSTSDRDRELLTIPRRRGAAGSRVVEVVHVRSGTETKDRPRRTNPQVRAVSWEDGFPTRERSAATMLADPPKPSEMPPTAHVMPKWEPPPADVAASPPARLEEVSSAAELAVVPRIPKALQRRRRVADPFDIDDHGANCIRCGYAIASAREKRGLMTCAGCE
jgi:hypothetical protein